MVRMNIGLLLLATISVCNYSFGQLWKKYQDSAIEYRSQREYDLALTYFRKAQDLLGKDSLYSEAYIETCRSIGRIYFLTGNYEEAIPFYEESNKIIRKLRGENDSLYAVNSDILGQAYFNNGDLGKAKLFFIKSKQLREALFSKYSLDYANSCNSLGNYYSQTSNYDKAEQLYLEAIEIRERILGKEDSLYAQSCNNLGDFYRKTAQYGKAEPYILEAMRIRVKMVPLGKHSVYAISCTNLANLYRDMGQYKQAEPLYIEAKNIRAAMDPVQKHPLYATSCNILADLYYQMEEYEKAERLYLEAKEIRSKVNPGQNTEYAQTCNNLAMVYLENGQLERALTLALEAKQIWDLKLPEGHPSFAINNNLLGAIYAANSQFKKAAVYYTKARNQWKKDLSTTHPYITQNASNLARVFWNTNEADKAKSLYTEAFNAQYKQVNRFFQFTNETEKQLYLKNINGSGDEVHSFYYNKISRTNAGQLYNISLQNRALILSSSRQLKQFLNKNTDTLIAVRYQEWIGLRKQLAYLYSKGELSQAGQVRVLEEKSGKLEKELTRSYSSVLSPVQNTITWQMIRQGISSTDAAIEFAEFQYYNGRRWTDSIYYVALIIRKELPAPLMVPLFEKRQFDSLQESKGNLSANSISTFYTRGAKLGNRISNGEAAYKLLWLPMEKHLKGIKTIYFAPSGLLNQVAFSALPATRTQVLSDKYRLIQLITTASIPEKADLNIADRAKLVLLGGIEYNGDTAELRKQVQLYNTGKSAAVNTNRQGEGTFSFLQGTLREVEEVQNQARQMKWPVELLTGIEASEESFKSLDGNASPAVLHIATHGFYFPPANPDEVDRSDTNENIGIVFRNSEDPLLRSGLIMAGGNYAWQGKPIANVEDGILTAYEVANMYLANTKLVVLSACETALGEVQGTEGVYGLQRAFKMAGAQNLVMSLWEVPDKETAEFMETFYRHLFKRSGIAGAFYKTQQEMRKKYFDQPYKWAAWVLVR